jgi:hypothetical protein
MGRRISTFCLAKLINEVAPLKNSGLFLKYELRPAFRKPSKADAFPTTAETDNRSYENEIFQLILMLIRTKLVSCG